MLWHKRVGHASLAKLKQMGVVSAGAELEFCRSCAIAKSKKAPQNREAIDRTYENGQMIHSDMSGPYSPPTQNGKQYATMLVDDKTGYQWLYLTKGKDGFDEKFEEFIGLEVKPMGVKVQRLHTDGGGEYVGKKTKSLFQAEGIKPSHSPPYNPEANGRAEAALKAAHEQARAMLIEADIPAKHWGPAMLTVVYLRNRLPSPRDKEKGRTPYELWTGKKPDMRKLRVFGTTCYIHIHTNRKKFAPKAEEGTFLGYDPVSDAYIVLVKRTGHLRVSKSVKFDEGHHMTLDTPTADELSEMLPAIVAQEPVAEKEEEKKEERTPIEQGQASDGTVPIFVVPETRMPKGKKGTHADISPLTPRSNTSAGSFHSSVTPEMSAKGTPKPYRRTSMSSGSSSGRSSTSHESSDASSRTGTIHDALPATPTSVHEAQEEEEAGDDESTVRRSSRRTRGLIGEQYMQQDVSPVHHDKWTEQQKETALIVFDDSPREIAYRVTDEPLTLTQALAGPLHAEWREAADIEYNALQSMGTWEKEPIELPPGRTAIGSKWVFKVKYNPDGTIRKFKGRIVALGCHQEEGVDYNETYAPTMRSSTLRIVLAAANQNDFDINQSDVSNAYLHADLKETIYLRQPDGYRDGTGRVLVLCKPLYGLKQSAMLWNGKLTTTIQEYGGVQSQNDPCLFTIRDDMDNLLIMIATHVDDLVQAGNETEIQRFQDRLDEQFKVVHEGELRYILGMEVKRDYEKNTLGVVQRKYSLDVVEKFGMKACNVKNTPLPGGFKLAPKSQEDEEDTDAPYRQLVGSVMYLATCTRPDLSYAMCVLTRRFDTPTKATWEAANMVLKFIKGTPDTGLLYKQSKSPQLVAFVDSDWAGEEETRKSTTGYVIMFCGSPVSWRAGLQKNVSTSSTEAEYVALCECTKEVVYLRRIVEECGCKQDGPTTIHVDNEAAVKLAHNQYGGRRTKHIELQFHFTRSKIMSGEVILTRISSAENPADIFTKALAFPAFRKHSKAILGGGAGQEAPEREGVKIP